MRDMSRIRFSAILALTVAVLTPLGLQAQEPPDTFPGVRLGLIYEAGFEPALAIKPFSSRFGGGGAEIQVEAIIARDLRYSDRFALMDSIPASLVGEGVDYNLWNPAKDPYLPARFSPKRMSGKAVCKKALIHEMGLDASFFDKPLLGMISRLDVQKGSTCFCRSSVPSGRWMRAWWSLGRETQASKNRYCGRPNGGRGE